MSYFYGTLTNGGVTNPRHMRGFRTGGLEATLTTSSIRAQLDLRTNQSGEDCLRLVVDGQTLVDLNTLDLSLLKAGKAKWEARLRK